MPRRTNLATLAIASLTLAVGTARADDAHAPARLCAASCGLNHAHARGPGVGTLGYGPPGPHPGFQGFGLGYHRGYGYGGAALGPGAEGGYPFYGGPGYIHPAPRLRRIGGINPFPHFAGPGGPTPDRPQFYGGVGPLVPDPPVVSVVGGAPEMGYGAYHGMVPYPASTFAPFTAAAGGDADAVTPPSP